MPLLIFCIYLLCDSNDYKFLEEYHFVLTEILLLCVKFTIDNIYILEDLNTDFARQILQHTQLILTVIA